ncbi:putative truncated NADH-flavin reductase [Lacticaseibacillus casei DSM 20011 = JCM 1134 = ATCC 393]|nr:putative truncated NADH-flavin reductase [Lacticaseibacillus casei DSM 20011 = JCM 1134 = ATCC 393]
MKIAVLGATGRAGSAIVAEAQRRGHEVLAVVRDTQKAASRLGQNVPTLVKAPLELTEAD